MKSLLKTLSFINTLPCLFNVTILSSCKYFENYLEPKSNGILPKKYLKISDDGKTLYGLNDNVTMQDIIIGGYDTLSIPDEITRIESYAFMFMFDHRTPSITKIVLNENLEEIGDYAFFQCSGINSVNFGELNDNCQLTKIGNYAFSKCKLSGDVKFPKSLTEICDCAFASGIDNGKIIIPSSVQKVGATAFQNCTNIKTLDLLQYQEIPDWLYNSNSIFYNFAYVQPFNLEVLVDTSINTLGQWQDALFNYQELPDIETVTFPQKDIRITPPSAFVIRRFKPEGFYEDKLVLERIADGYKLEDYDQVVVPDGVQVIGHSAFSIFAVEDTAKLTVVFPSSLECIQELAFHSAQWLVGFPFFSSYCTIGDKAFEQSGASGILDLSWFSKIGTDAFASCNFNTVKISPNSVITEKSPFSNNQQIDTLDFTYFDSESAPPDLERGLDQSSYFDDVFAYGKVLWPGKMTKMNKWNEFFAKSNFTGLDTGKWISIEETQESKVIPDDSFVADYNVRNIYGLTNDVDVNDYNVLQIPYTTQVICDGAFFEKFISDDKFWTLKLNNGLKTIGNLAFYNDSKLIYCDQFPNSIESIGIGAFQGNKYLSFNFRLPKNIKSIGHYAFYGCNNLWSTDLHIGNNVEQLGDYAFADWKYVKQLSISREAELHFGHKTFTNLHDLHILDFSSLTVCPSITWDLCSDTFNLGQDSSGTVYVNVNIDDTEKTAWENLLRNSGLIIDDNHWKVVRKT